MKLLLKILSTFFLATAFSARASNPTVLYTGFNFAGGATLTNRITIAPVSANTVIISGTNLIAGIPVTLTNGGSTTFAPNFYRCTLEGINFGFVIQVPDNTNTYNVASLVYSGATTFTGTNLNSTVSISSADTTRDYLGLKLTAAGGLIALTNSPGGAETFTISATNFYTNIMALLTIATNTIYTNLLAKMTTATNTTSTNLLALALIGTNTISTNLLAQITIATNTTSTNLLAQFTTGTNNIRTNLTAFIVAPTNSVFSTATNYTATLTDDTILLNGSTLTNTLPTAVGNRGKPFSIIQVTSSTGIVATASAQTISGAANYALTAQYKYVRVRSNGTNWLVIGSN